MRCRIQNAVVAALDAGGRPSRANVGGREVAVGVGRVVRGSEYIIGVNGTALTATYDTVYKVGQSFEAAIWDVPAAGVEVKVWARAAHARAALSQARA